ncbi:hypothetical protein, partial [Corynebacterium belfantii]|uniref:hypothetical protein n=1 Tax=Corynebacterium belfantii TaxID=2014537 RepID=UPI001A7E5407
LLNTNTILNQTNRSILGFLIKNLWHNPNSPILSNGRKPRPFHLRVISQTILRTLHHRPTDTFNSCADCLDRTNNRFRCEVGFE